MTRLLILVPTEFELHHLQSRFVDVVQNAGGVIAVCGFGVIASGIRTTRLLAQHKPASVILVGIAGALDPELRIGTAENYIQLGCYGIGAGSGSEFQTAAELGWKQWTDTDSGQSVANTIAVGNADPETPMLLTVCAASASSSDVAERLQKFPRAVAEDMEAFSVAMACRMANIPLSVIRGISNLAGDRDKSRWNVAGALEAAAELTESRILA